MSEAMTRLERVEADVEKAQAALGLVEGVLHTAVKVQATGRDSRKLLRTVGIFVVVGAVVGWSGRHRVMETPPATRRA